MGVRVLITGAGGDPAQGVMRALRNADHDYVIASTCIHDHSAGLYMSDISSIAPPCSENSRYINFLIEYINSHSIDILIPTIDGEMSLISQYQYQIKAQTKSKIIVGSFQDVTVCDDKLATSNYLKSRDISQPKTMAATDVEEIKYYLSNDEKIMMKPRFGGGSKGIQILDETNYQRSDLINDQYVYQVFDTYAKEFT